MQRIKPVLKLQRVVPSALVRRLLEIRAEPRCDVRRHRYAADTAHRVERERRLVITTELDKVGPAGEPLSGHTPQVTRRVLHAQDVCESGDFAERLDRDVHDGPRWHVVNNDW